MITVPIVKNRRFCKAVEIPAGWIVQLSSTNRDGRSRTYLLNNGTWTELQIPYGVFYLRSKYISLHDGGFVKSDGTLTTKREDAYVVKKSSMKCVLVKKPGIRKNWLNNDLYSLFCQLLNISEEEKQTIVIGNKEKIIKINPTDEKIVSVCAGSTTIIVATRKNIIVLDNPLI